MTNWQKRTNPSLYWYATNITGDSKISKQYLSKQHKKICKLL